MNKFDDIADAIKYAADTLNKEAENLYRIEKRTRERGDYSGAVSAISVICQLPALCRCDVIASRCTEDYADLDLAAHPPGDE